MLLERCLPLAACGCALAAVVWPHARRRLTRLAAGLLTLATGLLAWHLTADHFDYRYVWLYSGAALPWHLKLANLWGGDEGTLLFLAALLAISTVRLIRYPGWAGPGALLLAAVFALGATVWSPFTPTSPEELARAASQGMNVHLIRIWMALHPPLIFIAYVFILAPAGAALEALARGTGEWPAIAQRWGRTGWLILSAGLGAGMWWAYEDFTFGQFWHWDPVQTSVFTVWALATAYQHGLRCYRPDGLFARALPALALLAAVAALASMAVTRNAVLASSHRYIGNTSLPGLLALAVILALATIGAWVYALRRPTQRQRRRGDAVLVIRIAVLAFSIIAVVAAYQLARAYGSAYLELPRPASLKPFFESLARWTHPQELAELRRAFAQWDVDNFALNAGLAPLGLVVALFGGHAFLRLPNRALGWAITAAAAGLALATAYYLKPLDGLFHGNGMTSRHTVAIFFWLDAMLAGAAYLILSASFWMARVIRRLGLGAALAYAVPVGLTHVGVMVALIGALSATVLDSYAQQVLRYPDDFGKVQRFPDGYALTVNVERDGYVADGGRATQGADGFQAIGQVNLLMEGAGEASPIGSGETLYRDQRAPLADQRGSMRQLCEMLDYRYARYASGPAYRLDPFIARGFWRDVQVWLPGLDYASKNAGRPERRASAVTVVIKTYPLLSWLWLGLVLAILGAATLTAAAWRSRYQPPRHEPG